MLNSIIISMPYTKNNSRYSKNPPYNGFYSVLQHNNNYVAERTKEEKYMVEELKPMLENISGKKLDELCDDECLFSRKYAMNARDIVYFLVEIEERYGVVFDKE